MAKYDHGGGCACGLSRFCDCSQATEKDRKDREEYDRLYGKKEKPVALKQIEDAYNEGHRPKVRGTRVFKPTKDDSWGIVAFMQITGGTISEDVMTGNKVVSFYTRNDMLRDYLVNVWQPGMPAEPGPTKAKIEFEKDEIVFLSIAFDAFLDQVKKTMPDVALPPVAGAVQKKLALFKKEMEK